MNTLTAPAPETALAPLVDLGVIRAQNASGLVRVATEVADALADVIEKKQLYKNITGRKYVLVEGWTTLAAMLGFLPREVSNTGVDGVYTAVVELVRMSDGASLSRASAECGDEPPWNKRELYARRSMACSRAVSKVCRISFSWVMVMAGYEATPSDEIPDDEPEPRQAEKPKPRERPWKPSVDQGRAMVKAVRDAGGSYSEDGGRKFVTLPATLASKLGVERGFDLDTIVDVLTWQEVYQGIHDHIVKVKGAA